MKGKRCFNIILVKLTLLLFAYFLYSGQLFCQRENVPVLKFNTESKLVSDICLTEKGEAIAVTDNSTVKVFSTDRGELLGEFKNGHKKEILVLDVSADSALLASGGKDSIIVIWNFKTGELIKSLNFHKALITSLDFSPDCKYLISGDSDGRACLYNLSEDRLMSEFHDHTNDITCAEFGPDGKLFATAGGDKMIYIYRTGENEKTASLRGHKNWVRDLSFSNDGSKMISCGDDSRILLWQINKQDLTGHQISKHPFSWITGIDFHHDNQTFAYCNLNGRVSVILPFSSYHVNLKVPVNQIIFKYDKSQMLKVAVATMGKGAMLINRMYRK